MRTKNLRGLPGLVLDHSTAPEAPRTGWAQAVSLVRQFYGVGLVQESIWEIS